MPVCTARRRNETVRALLSRRVNRASCCVPDAGGFTHRIACKVRRSHMCGPSGTQYCRGILLHSVANVSNKTEPREDARFWCMKGEQRVSGGYYAARPPMQLVQVSRTQPHDFLTCITTAKQVFQSQRWACRVMQDIDVEWKK